VKVIYSIGARFAGGGIGTTAYHGVRGLSRHGALQRLLCGSFCPTEIPVERIRAMGLPSRAMRKLATFDPSRRLWHLQSVLYDAWAVHQLESADLLLVWANKGLRTLCRARAMGMVTVVERASAHPLHQKAILSREYARWGLSFHIPKVSLRRAEAEFDVADYVLIPSDFVRDSFLSHGFTADRLLQVPFGVDAVRFHPAQERAAGPFRVIFVGQVGIRKGVHYLLEAWKRLHWTEAELWLVGQVKPDFDLFRERFEGLPGLRWVGHVSDPVALYQRADVFTFPSLEEGSALVTYEALACGLPLITTPNAGSVARDGIEGLLVSVCDADALADRLERLRADEQLRCEMGIAARKRAEQFPWARHEDRIVEVLQGVVVQGRLETNDQEVE